MYNVINDTFLNIKRESFGLKVEEKDIYSSNTNSYLYISGGLGNKMPLYTKMLTYNTIYITRGKLVKVGMNCGIGEMIKGLQCNQLIIPSEFINGDMVQRTEIVLFLEANSYGKHMNEINKKVGKYKRVILYCDTTFDWDSIVYNWRDKVEKLTLIIREEQGHASSPGGMYQNIENVLPPSNIKNNFSDLEIIVLMENEIKGTENYKYLLEHSEMRQEMGEILKEMDEGRVLMKDLDWTEIIYRHYRYSPNLYRASSSRNLVDLYNQHHVFKDQSPVILYVKPEDWDVKRNRKRPDNLFINLPHIIPILESINEYKKVKNMKI